MNQQGSKSPRQGFSGTLMVMRPVDLLLKPMPRSLKRRAEGFVSLFNLKPWENLSTLFPYWRYRREFARLQRAFFYYRYAVALLFAHELELFELLNEKPMTLEELQERLSLKPRPLEQLLRVLEGEGFVERRGERFFLAPHTRVFLLRSSPQSLRGFLDLFVAHHSSFAGILKGMKDGTIPPKMNIFSSRARVEGYLFAVNTYLHWLAPELLRRLSLPRIERFIVGSMGVSFSAQVLRAYPQARVTYGCLPHLVKRIPLLVERFEVPEERIEGMHSHIGDPEKDRWGEEEHYDLVFLTKKLILKPEERIGEKFVAKAYEVLNPGGALILWETVHPHDHPTPIMRAMEAVLDLGASPDGLVLTERRVRNLLRNYGFRGISFLEIGDMGSTFVVARK